MKNFFLILLLSSTFALKTRAQSPGKDIVALVDTFGSKYPIEKVHLQFDKPYYSIGDTMWIKAYVVNAAQNLPSALSQILYVDLINESDSLKIALKLPLVLGTAGASMVLTDSLLEGNYRIRAFTNWMRNFGDDGFFWKTIPIGNAFSRVLTNASFSYSSGDNSSITANIRFTTADDIALYARDVSYSIHINDKIIGRGKEVTDSNGNIKIKFPGGAPTSIKSGIITTVLNIGNKQTIQKIIPIKAASDSPSVQFFPEGGNMVEYIRSNVGFKALGPDGLHVDVSGYVVDKAGVIVVESFKSDHAGMGRFAFMPMSGNSYFAVVRFPDGSEKKYQIPRALETGYVLSVDNSKPSNIVVKVGASTSMLEKRQELRLIAKSNNGIRFYSKNQLKTNQLSASIPITRFPTGIAQFTLFADDVPVAERLVFINNNDQLQLSLSTGKNSFAPRELVKTDIKVSDEKSNPVRGNFSMSVTDMTKVPYDDGSEISIFSNLLLSSDLKGYVEKPNFYFSGELSEKQALLDNLMLTQGWRRFTWSEMLTGTTPNLAFKPENGIQVSGTLRRYVTKQPVANVKITLFTAQGGPFVVDTVTDSDGRFVFDRLNFPDSTHFVIQAKNSKERVNFTIELHKTPGVRIEKAASRQEIKVNVNYDMLPYLENARENFKEMEDRDVGVSGTKLKEVKIVGNRTTKPPLPHTSNLNGASGYDYAFTGEDINLFGAGMSLTAKIPGLQTRFDPVSGETYIVRNIRGVPVKYEIFLDGMDMGKNIDVVNPVAIASLEVLESPMLLSKYPSEGGKPYEGVVIINTKVGTEQTVEGIMSYKPKGYSAVRQFYSPVYTPENNKRPMRDLRSTIYWNPGVVSENNGMAEVDFFTADTPGTYRIVIEGLDFSGKLGRKVSTITVK